MVGLGHQFTSESRPAAGPPVATVTDLATITDAYVYLLGRALVIRQERLDRKAKGFAYNTLRYNPLGTADFANPNFDHSRKAKLLGRVELRGDPDGAVELQRKFRLSTTGDPAIADPPDLPDFDNSSLPGAELFAHVEEVLASALDVSPVAAEMQQKVHAVADYVAGGGREKVDRLIRSKVIPGFEHYAFNDSAPSRNHWIGGGAAGNYGKDFRLRTCVNYAGIWANSSEEVLYFVASKDAGEKAFSGSNGYVMHFPADGLPDTAVEACWSVTLLGLPDCRVVPNELERYNFNNHSALTRESDGSLQIGFGPAPVAGVPESNWLPTARGRPFSLTFRTYVPGPGVRSGEWALPPVTRVSG
jgi:hypothetical protein